MATKNVLAELMQLGVVGAGSQRPSSAVKREEILPAEDARGRVMVEACEKAVHAVTRVLEAQEDLRSSLLEMLSVMTGAEPAPEENAATLDPTVEVLEDPELSIEDEEQ